MSQIIGIKNALFFQKKLILFMRTLYSTVFWFGSTYDLSCWARITTTMSMVIVQLYTEKYLANCGGLYSWKIPWLVGPRPYVKLWIKRSAASVNTAKHKRITCSFNKYKKKVLTCLQITWENNKKCHKWCTAMVISKL
jgi:hypothetical protein